MENGLSCAYVTRYVWLRRRSTCSQCDPSGLAAKAQAQASASRPVTALAVCLSPAQPRLLVQSRPLNSHTPLLPLRPLHCSTAASGAAQGFKKSPRSSPNRVPSQVVLVKLRHFSKFLFCKGTLLAYLSLTHPWAGFRGRPSKSVASNRAVFFHLKSHKIMSMLRYEVRRASCHSLPPLAPRSRLADLMPAIGHSSITNEHLMTVR